jgi:hypothetical protein
VHAGAGVVYQSVDPLVPVECGGRQVAHLRRIGHVGGHGQRPVEFLAQRGQPVGPARGQHRIGPGGMQQAGGGRADTRGRTGDDHRLASQVNEIGHEPSCTRPGAVLTCQGCRRAGQVRRRPSRQKQKNPARDTARARNIPVSIPWRGQ